MCGIIHVKRTDGIPAKKMVIKRYQKQKRRGSNGFGYIAIKNDSIVGNERATTEKEILDKLQKENAPEILFHHRLPTHGPNLPELAHPLLVTHPDFKYQYYVAHNGIISNHSFLRTRHLDEGFVYRTEVLTKQFVQKSVYVQQLEWNDSEALAIETALALENKKTTIDTEGAAAVIVLQVKNNQVINRFAYRNLGNPLNYHKDKKGIVLSSEGEGTTLNTYSVYRILDNGDKEEVKGIVSPISYQSYPYKQTEKRVGFVSTKESASFKNLVEKYDINTLWREFDWTTLEVEHLKNQLTELDIRTTAGSGVDDVQLRTKLVSRLRSMEDYENVLDAEIRFRTPHFTSPLLPSAKLVGHGTLEK